jgi:glutamate N-acetyltransferase/amino-acid N-acetyltransferase
MPNASSTLRDFTIAPASGGVTAPQGFRSAALHCGIKAVATSLDLTVLAADGNASSAVIFTTNLAQAAPVLVAKRHLARSTASLEPSS